jgi:hypothetical protein
MNLLRPTAALALCLAGCTGSLNGDRPDSAAGASGGRGGSQAGGGSGGVTAGTGGGAGGSATGGGGGSAAGGRGGGTAGSGGSTTADAGSDGTAAMVRLKGLAGGSCADLAKLGVSWFYNWGISGNCPNIEFVPMLWGDWETDTTRPTPARITSGGFKVMLGFNEPDHPDQANMTVAQALHLWPQTDLPGVRVGSPATASDGQTWFQQFMTGVQQQNLRVDFIAIHWYGWNAGSCNNVTGLENYIKWAEQWNRPIWLTEWSCRMQSVDVTKKFYDDSIAMFAKHPLLERYGWFLARTATDANFSMATLLDANGNLTTIGQDYAAAPAFH